jgi:hypothetical protein
MTSAPAQNPIDELRAGLLELTEACPVDQCNPADCPLNALREMRPADRLCWFNALSQADLEYLAAYHYACMKVRISSRRAPSEL